jgi:hypothetical protein
MSESMAMHNSVGGWGIAPFPNAKKMEHDGAEIFRLIYSYMGI